MLGNGVTRFVDMGAPCGDDVALDEEFEHDFAKKQRMHRNRRLRNARNSGPTCEKAAPTASVTAFTSSSMTAGIQRTAKMSSIGL